MTKEIKLKVAEAVQEYENQRFSIVQQVGHDVNKGSENQKDFLVFISI